MSAIRFVGEFPNEERPADSEACLTQLGSCHFDAVIAGAGVVGAACAWQLARAGLSVGIVDACFVASGATAAGMGHIVVMDDSEAQFRLTSWSRQLWRELAEELPLAAEYRECGTLWVAADDEEMAAAELKRKYAAARGVEASMASAKEIARLEPHLRAGLKGGLLVPGDGVVYAPQAARWMLARAMRRGAVYRHGVTIELLENSEARLSDGSCWSAKTLLNAAGINAAKLSPGLPIQPRKGHLAITDRAPGFIAHQIVELGYLKSAHSQRTDSVAFNLCPRPTGQILIGSSRQLGVTDAAVERPMLEAMLRRALAYMPALRDLSAIRCWAGFRAATPDNLPLIGPHPKLEGVWVAAGHEGLGITTCLGTAHLLAAMITGIECAIPAAPYLPSRFDAKEGVPAHG